MWSNRLLAFFGLPWLILSGCEYAPVVNPVSDEKTSQIDEQLLGTYVIPREREVFTQRDRPELRQVVIQRSKAHANVHEITGRWLDADNNVRDFKWPIRTIFLGEVRVASVPVIWTPADMTADETGTDVPTEPIIRYWILAYELRPTGELYIRRLNSSFISAAIEKGELKGELTPLLPPRPDDDEAKRREVSFSGVRVTASTEELAAFLRKHQFAAFQAESKAQLLYRRVK